MSNQNVKVARDEMSAGGKLTLLFWLITMLLTGIGIAVLLRGDAVFQSNSMTIALTTASFMGLMYMFIGSGKTAGKYKHEIWYTAHVLVVLLMISASLITDSAVVTGLVPLVWIYGGIVFLLNRKKK